MLITFSVDVGVKDESHFLTTFVPFYKIDDVTRVTHARMHARTDQRERGSTRDQR